MGIGEAVRYWRNRRALNQGELARLVGISQNSLSRIETGEHKPRSVTIRKLAEALKLDVEQLTAAGEDSKPPIPTDGTRP